MDLDEYTLTESERALKRQGVTHLWRPASLASPSVSPETATLAAETPAGRVQSSRNAQPLSLPPLFKALFHGKHPPVRTLWTYAELAQDLASSSEPSRLNIFRKIQDAACSHLHWSQDDICTWPLDPSLEVFRAGLAFFQPQVVLCFGPPLGPASSGVTKECAVGGVSALVLPSLDDMAAGNQGAKNHAWKILQSLSES